MRRPLRAKTKTKVWSTSTNTTARIYHHTMRTLADHRLRVVLVDHHEHVVDVSTNSRSKRDRIYNEQVLQRRGLNDFLQAIRSGRLLLPSLLCLLVLTLELPAIQLPMTFLLAMVADHLCIWIGGFILTLLSFAFAFPLPLSVRAFTPIGIGPESASLDLMTFMTSVLKSAKSVRRVL